MSAATEEIERIITNTLKISGVSIPDKPENNCTGALVCDGQFDVFKKNFYDRLTRLSKKLNSTGRQELGKKLKELAIKPNNKWAGPYSEIIALDAILSEKDVFDFEYVSVKDGKSISGSLASKNKALVIDNDFSFKYHRTRINGDVKSLVPDSFELLDKIREEIETNTPNVLIGITETEDLSVSDIQSILAINRVRIKNELEVAVKNKEHSLCIAVKDKEINFAMVYMNEKHTTLCTQKSLNPYKSATIDSFKPIYHFGKLMPSDYNFFVYVTNPWWNNNYPCVFDDCSREYYRSFARRLFVGLQNDNRLISDIGAESSIICIGEVSKQIAGLMFIEDYSITKSELIYGCYLYLNPNYEITKPLNKYDFGNLFRQSDLVELKEIDDFGDDNY